MTESNTGPDDDVGDSPLCMCLLLLSAAWHSFTSIAVLHIKRTVSVMH